MAATASKPSISPTLLVFGSMISIQLGSAIAKPLMADLGSAGVVLLRVGFAALMLVAWQRPSWRGYSNQNYRNLLGFGIAMAVMSGFYYASIERLPIGIAVAIEFLGPLGVAVYKSRKRLVDWLWVALAAVGIALLSPTPESNLDPLGVLYALIAAVGWGGYILASAKAGESLPGRQVVPISMSIAALMLLPLGVGNLGPAIANPKLLLIGALVGFLGSVVTYSLEFAALKWMPVSVFGVLMSLEPAIAAMLGFGLLGETLSPAAIVAIVLVSIAAAGASYSEKENPSESLG